MANQEGRTIYINNNGTAEAFANLTPKGESGASALSDLSDVDLSSLSSGQGLIYNSATGKWENGAIGGASNYNDLSNRPQINRNILTGNKTSAQLGIPEFENYVDYTSYFTKSGPSADSLNLKSVKLIYRFGQISAVKVEVSTKAAIASNQTIELEFDKSASTINEYETKRIIVSKLSPVLGNFDMDVSGNSGVTARYISLGIIQLSTTTSLSSGLGFSFTTPMFLNAFYNERANISWSWQ